MTPWYEVLVVIQSIIMFSISLNTVGLDTTGPSFIMAACGYLRLLAERIEQLNNNKTHGNQRDLENKIVSCVIYHQQLLQSV